MGRWSDIEVARLCEACSMYSEWVDIVKHVGTRDKSQCQSKWKQLQKSKKDTHKWGEKEHKQVDDHVNQLPYCWNVSTSVCILKE